jgi:hypothetical protein
MVAHQHEWELVGTSSEHKSKGLGNWATSFTEITWTESTTTYKCKSCGVSTSETTIDDREEIQW